MSDSNRIFISCVSREFQHPEDPNAPFAGLREHLAHTLIGLDCEVKWQEVFHQPGDDTDTVRKVGDSIRTCAAMIHLIGAHPGAPAKPEAVADFLRAEPEFLGKDPKLRAALGDFGDLTYTQWEVFQALHYGLRHIFLYATRDGAKAQREHLNRLCLARRYPGEPFETERDLYGQIMRDVGRIIPTLGREPRLAPSRFAFRHHAEEFLGRQAELAWLDRGWASGIHCLSIVAWGGVGKTALLAEWLRTRFFASNFRDADGQPMLAAYFDWSFYDQGSVPADDRAAARVGSVGTFFEQALAFFGDPDPARPGQGERLAGLVQAQRTLFVIDGLEPLQHPPGSAQVGRLLDPGLETFIHTLAQRNPGMLILTSRQALPDLDGPPSAVSDQRDLQELSRETAIRLLRQLQVTGTDAELAAACERFGCHALSLTLLGRFLCDAHGGDIRRIDRVDLHRADLATPDRHRHAWKVLAAYEEWLHPPAPAGGWAARTWRRLGRVVQGRLDPGSAAAALSRRQTLAVLRLTGLFDRPADPGLLRVLRQRPAIRGFTEDLVDLDEDGWRSLLRGLERARLIRLDTDPEGAPGLDAHPLIREYFAEQLRRHQPAAFTAAHGRLFDHLCASTPHRPDDLAGLQPLYQAVRHGCLAGRHREACEKVYRDRILRGTGAGGNYSTFKLGAINADLGAVAAFFDEPWGRVSPNLAEPDRAWLLNEAAYYLRALGRLTEALGPMRVVGEMVVQAGQWERAAASYSNLSELEVTLGALPDAVTDARAAVDHADRSGDASRRMLNRTTAADALHQSGARAEAGRLFAEAERMQREWQPLFPLLYSLRGFQYGDWRLAPAERAAWRVLLDGGTGFQPVSGTAGLQHTAEPLAPAAPPRPGATTAADPDAPAPTDPLAACDEAERRAATALDIVLNGSINLLDIGLNHLTLARARLLRALLTGPLPPPGPDPEAVTVAVAGLRRAGLMDHLPRALLTAAWTAALRGDPDAAPCRSSRPIACSTARASGVR